MSNVKNLKSKIISAITAATMAVTAFGTVLPISLALTNNTQITASAADNVSVKAAGIKYYNAVDSAVRVELDNTGADVYKVWLCGDTSFAANKTRYVRLERKTGTRFDNLASKGGTYYIRTQACKNINGRWYYSSSVTTKISLNKNVSDVGIKYYNAVDSAVRLELDRADATVYKVWLCGDTSFAANKTRYVRLEGNTKTVVRFDSLSNKGGTYYIRTQACKSFNGQWIYSTPYTTKIQLNTGVYKVGVKSYTATEDSVNINLDRSDATVYKIWLCGDTSFAANKTRYARLEGNTNTDVSFKNLANRGGTYYVKTQACKSFNGKWSYSSAITQVVKLKGSDTPVINPTRPINPTEPTTTKSTTTTTTTKKTTTTTKPTTTTTTTTTTTKPTTKPTTSTTKPTSSKTVGIIGLNNVQRDSSNATIKFNAAKNATGYRIWVCKKYNANNTPIDPVILSNYTGETSFKLTGLDPNTTYYYWIRPFMFYYPDGKTQTTQWGESYYNCFTTTDLSSSYEVPIDTKYDNETQTAKKLVTLWASTMPTREDFESTKYAQFNYYDEAEGWIVRQKAAINNRLTKSEVAAIVAKGTTWAQIDEFCAPTEVTQSTKYFNADGTWKQGVVREHANVSDQTRAWIATNISGKNLSDRQKVQLINEYTCQLLAPMMEMYSDQGFDLYFSSATGNLTTSPDATGRQEELDKITREIFREIKSVERIDKYLYVFYYDNYDEDGYNDYPDASTRPIYGLIFASICYEAGVDVYDPGLSSANKMTNVFYIEEDGIKYYTSPLLNQYSKLGKYGGENINSYTNVAEGSEKFTQLVTEYNNLVQYTVNRWDEKVAADPTLPSKAGSIAQFSPLREWVIK